MSETKKATATAQPLTTAERKSLEYIKTEFVDLDDALVNLPDSADKLKTTMLKQEALKTVRQRLTNAYFSKVPLSGVNARRFNLPLPVRGKSVTK